MGCQLSKDYRRGKFPVAVSKAATSRPEAGKLAREEVSGMGLAGNFQHKVLVAQ